MPRSSNRGRNGNSHETRSNRMSAAASYHGHSQRCHRNGDAQGISHGSGSGFGSAVLGEGAPAPAMERDSRAVGAPPGVGGGGGRLHPAVTWWPGCGRKARAGDGVPSKGAAKGSRCFVVLKGRDAMREARCTGKLSEAEARAIAQPAASQALTGGRVLAMKAGRAQGLTLPKHPADRTRAVMRLTKRVIGRPVGIKACMEGLRAIGWCKVKGA